METQFSIGAALITKDRLTQLHRLLPQLSKLDQVVVVDTSPVPDAQTRTYVRKLGKPFEYHHAPFRNDPQDYDPNDWGFAAARNFSFSKLKTTHAFWIDTDDMVGVLQNGRERALSAKEVGEVFRNVIAKAPDTDMWYIDYMYGHDDKGNVTWRHARERLFKLDKQWNWVYPIHECAVPTQPASTLRLTDVVIIHKKEQDEVSDKEDVERNYRFLIKWYKQLLEIDSNHYDMPRVRFGVGAALWSLGKHTESNAWFENEFLAKHPNANHLTVWDAYNYMWRNAWELGDLDAAEVAALKGIEVCPQYAESYLFLARVKLARDDDPKGILKLLEYTSASEDTPSEVIANPLDQTFYPYMVAATCKFELGDYEGAMHWIEKAIRIVPDDAQANYWYQKIVTKVKESTAKQAAFNLYQILTDYEENEKAAKLYELLPYAIQEDEDIRVAAIQVMERTKHLRSDAEYEKLYEQGERYEPITDEQFEAGFIPGEDRFAYVVKRLKNDPTIKTVLDVGCSDGFHSLALAKLGYQVVGVDIDPKAIEKANERAKKYDLPAVFIQGFFERMDLDKTINPLTGQPFAEGFDAVISEEVLEHVQDPQFFLDSLGDCTRQDGIVVITTPDGSFGMGLVPEQDIDNKAVHVRAYTQSTLEALLSLSQEFRVTECHFLPWRASGGTRGWRVAELKKSLRPDGPRIRMFCGNGTSFTPDDVDGGGVGGSETAVVHMTRAWAALGCQVVVYGAKSGIWDGVYYRTIEDWNSEHESDLFIAWRLPQIFDYGRPNAKHTVLWAHDLYYPTGISAEAADRIDTVAVLSDFHKGYMEDKHPTIKGKCWITRNGIASSRFAGEVERIPHRYFYSSSYDRGLEQLLLEHWPRIKAAIPDAELHVAYGLQSAREICKRNGEFEKLEHLEKLAQAMEDMDGVVNHDRISQIELAQLQMSCDAWLYPPHHFLETYCITALEAQAAGAIPVTRLNGAIPEVVKSRVEWTEESDIVELLNQIDKKPAFYNKVRETNKQWALSQTWNALSVEWLKYFEPKEG